MMESTPFRLLLGYFYVDSAEWMNPIFDFIIEKVMIITLWILTIQYVLDNFSAGSVNNARRWVLISML